jgi:hypothetical protein
MFGGGSMPRVLPQPVGGVGCWEYDSSLCMNGLLTEQHPQMSPGHLTRGGHRIRAWFVGAPEDDAISHKAEGLRTKEDTDGV